LELEIPSTHTGGRLLRCEQTLGHLADSTVGAWWMSRNLADYLGVSREVHCTNAISIEV
jgi:hypothetical protein